MKIAICLSGHLRYYKSISQQYQKFVNHLQRCGDIDTFVCCWNTEDAKYCRATNTYKEAVSRHDNLIDIEDVKQYYNTEHVQVLDYGYYSSINSPFTMDKLTNTYFDDHHGGIRNNIVGCTCMYFMIYMSNLMKSQHEFKYNMKYNLVFRIRPDYLFNSGYTNIKLNNIGDFLCVENGGPDRVADRFFYGYSRTMDKVSNTWLSLSEYFHCGIFGDPETFLCKHLKKTGVKYMPIGECGNCGKEFKQGEVTRR